MKKLFLVLLGMAVTASSQPANTARILLWQYNLLAASAPGGTPVYCAPGTAISTGSRVYSGTGGVVSSSTTLTAVSGTPFLGVSAGAMLLIVDSNGSTYRRAVTVASSSTSVVISGAALTITSGKIQDGGSQNPNGSTNMNCGITSAFGAFDVKMGQKFQIQVGVGQQVNTGGLTFHLQCRVNPEADWAQVSPALTWPTVTPSYTSALASGTTGTFILGTVDAYSQCRIGARIVTSDDVDDLGLNAEQISYFLIEMPK